MLTAALAATLAVGALAVPAGADTPTGPADAPTGATISTVLGSGYAAFCGVRGPRRTCIDPSGAAAAADGSVFVADADNDLVWKLDGATMSIYAGVVGQTGNCPDGADATGPCLDQPSGLATDAAGNLYVAEAHGRRVDRIDPSQHITHFAGTGRRNDCGHNGGPANLACLNSPRAVVISPAGVFFIADAGDDVVRRVDTTGIITTVAGSGQHRFCGDNGPATSACIHSPSGLALDDDGNLFIADTENDRVRRVDTTGTITTVAGKGVDQFCGDSGPATSACVGEPLGVAVDATGRIDISTQYRIRAVDPTTQVITTIAGTGDPDDCADSRKPMAACLSPQQLAVDSTGRLLIAERLRVRALVGGALVSIVGNGERCGDGGPAVLACGVPTDIVTDVHGNVYFFDSYRFVRRIDAATGIVTTIAGGGTAPDCHDDVIPARRACPLFNRGMTVADNGDVYVVDGALIRKIDAQDIIATVAGAGTVEGCGDDGVPALSSCISPDSLTFGPDHSLYFSDYRRVRHIDRQGKVRTVAGGGTGRHCGDQGIAPRRACLLSTSDTFFSGPDLLFDDYGTSANRMLRVHGGALNVIAGTGSGIGCDEDGTPAADACFGWISGLEAAPSGAIVFAEYAYNRADPTQFVREIDPGGIVRNIAGTPTDACDTSYEGPAVNACVAGLISVALDPHGDIYLSEAARLRVVQGASL